MFLSIYIKMLQQILFTKQSIIRFQKIGEIPASGTLLSASFNP